MAQWIRRKTTNLEIAGSSPAGDGLYTKCAFVAQLAEHSPSKRKVTGSSPVGGWSGPSGAMDSALDFESSGCGFESRLGCQI